MDLIYNEIIQSDDLIKEYYKLHKKELILKSKEYHALNKERINTNRRRYRQFNKLVQELPFYRIPISTSLY